MTALDRAAIALIRAADCRIGYLRADYLYRARDELNAAGHPRWAEIAESAALRIGGDGSDMERLLFDIDLECSRERHALEDAADG